MDDSHLRFELGGLFHIARGLAIVLSIFNNNIGLSAWIDQSGSEISFKA
ncbi:hypothetical protein [Algoriphagus sp. PAP.12]|nr:hypothetical protein [Algoriphagus sp. PAP.12]